MAPTIWGLHLGPPEFRWGKFKSSYMFKNREYHLRRTKFVVYQLAMILCVVSESLGTAVLSDYVDQQKAASRVIAEDGAHRNGEYNDDYVACASYNIFCGVFVAFIFGAAFFFDLFWPERHEDRGIRNAWRGCSVAATIFLTADIALMTWVTSSREAYITGPNAAQLEQQLRNAGRYALVYRKNGRAVAALVFLWLGWIATIAATIVMWMALAHDDRVGPLATHARHKKLELEQARDSSPSMAGPATADDAAGQYAGGPATGAAGQRIPLQPTIPQSAHTAATT